MFFFFYFRHEGASTSQLGPLATCYPCTRAPQSIPLLQAKALESMATHRQFLCRSNYQHCSRCATKITPGETLRGKPPTDEPLVGWTDACCFPNCKQAVKDRAARTTPYPEVDLSPQDHSFRNRYPNNYCCICGGEIKIGARMTSTKHDVPEGHRAWFNKRHERCSLAVRISNKAR